MLRGAVLTLSVGVVSAGCGDDGAATTMGGGGVGAGGAAVGGAAASGGLGSGGMGAAGGSDGGGSIGGAGPTACEQACAQYVACSLPDPCEDNPTGCDSSVVGDCVYNCLAGAPCGELAVWPTGSAPVINACVGACNGGSPCLDCAVASVGAGEACEGALAACSAKPACVDWSQCFARCNTPACFDACDAQFPGAAPENAALYACVCGECGEVCASVMGPCT